MSRLFRLMILAAVALPAISCSKPTGPQEIGVADVGPVFAKRQRPSYQKQALYARSMTDEQCRAAVAAIMSEFKMPDEMWDKCMTYEVYARKVAESELRPGMQLDEERLEENINAHYTRIQGPPQYLSSLRLPDLKFVGRVKPRAKLTSKEKLYITKLYPFKVLPENDLELWRGDLLQTVFSALMRNWWNDRSKTMLVRKDQLFIDYFDMRYLLNPMKRMNSSEWQAWVERWLYEYTSPITNEVIETWHEEFSPGNGYFVLIPESGSVDKLWAHLTEETQATFPRSDTYFMYYRLYGEKAVIAEGFYAGYTGNTPIERGSEREEVQGLRTQRQRTSILPGK
jgi:hypothetical protein